mgnify:CR=1 FL=1
MNESNKFISNVEKLLGLTIDLTLNNNTKFSGVIYTLNQNSKMIILINRKSDNDNFNITFINMLQIKKIELSKNQLNIKVDDLYPSSINNVQEKEKRNLDEDNLMRRIEIEPNFKKGFDLYKILSKFYNCSYDGKKIILEGIDCFIEEPFKVQNINCNNPKLRKKIESLII